MCNAFVEETEAGFCIFVSSHPSTGAGRRIRTSAGRLRLRLTPSRDLLSEGGGNLRYRPNPPSGESAQVSQKTPPSPPPPHNTTSCTGRSRLPCRGRCLGEHWHKTRTIISESCLNGKITHISPVIMWITWKTVKVPYYTLNLHMKK